MAENGQNQRGTKYDETRHIDTTQEFIPNADQQKALVKLQNRRKTEGDKFKWVVPYWNGTIPEWQMHGVSTRVDHRSPITVVTLEFHMSRQWGYYLYKALVPLYMLTILTFSVFQFDVLDVQNRAHLVVTCFLASSATLHVVGESLPKTDFLTLIDKAILLSTVNIVIIGVEAWVIGAVANTDYAAAEKWDRIIMVGLAVLYGVTNLYIVAPPVYRHWRAMWLLDHAPVGEQGGELLELKDDREELKHKRKAIDKQVQKSTTFLVQTDDDGAVKPDTEPLRTILKHDLGRTKDQREADDGELEDMENNIEREDARLRSKLQNELFRFPLRCDGKVDKASLGEVLRKGAQLPTVKRGAWYIPWKRLNYKTRD